MALPEITVVVITPGPILSYLCVLGHTSEAPRDDVLLSWESASLRVQNPVWMVVVTGVRMCLHKPCQSLPLETQRQKAHNG